MTVAYERRGSQEAQYYVEIKLVIGHKENDLL